jgi:hypothetical protein
MIRWNDEQLAAAGINKRRLRAIERRLRTTAREMRSMKLYLHFDRNDSACLVYESRPPFDENGGNDLGGNRCPLH